MSASPELLERVLSNPEGSSPMDRLIVGLAVIGGIQDDPNSQKIDRSEPLNTSLALATDALNQIRTNPETNEAQKLFLAQQVLSAVDFQKLPDSKEHDRFFVATLLTLAGGVRTTINEQMEELRRGINRGYFELAEEMLYGEIKDELTPREKIIYLCETFGNYSPEDRRQIAILRACQFATDPEVDDDAFGDMIKYFSEIGDQEALGQVSIAKLESVIKKPAT